MSEIKNWLRLLQSENKTVRIKAATSICKHPESSAAHIAYCMYNGEFQSIFPDYDTRILNAFSSGRERLKGQDS